MAEIKFSYKEAIVHGWTMTKKYLAIIFVISAVYMFINIVGGVLDHFAGKDTLTKHDIRTLISDAEGADAFFVYLQEAGYIDPSGRVQQRLQSVASADDLDLPAELKIRRQEIYDFLNGYRYKLPFPKPVYFVLSVALWLVSMVMSIGYVKANLMMSRDEEPSASVLFTNWDILIPSLLAGVCYGLAVVGGFILLIVPGIIFMLMFQFYQYLIIDKGLGPIESLKRSRVITKGSRWRLAVLGMFLTFLNLGGLLCLVVGLFFTVSISAIAMAYVYNRLETAQESSPQV